MVSLLFTKQTFSIEVEKIARHDRLSYVEAVVEICGQHDIDVRDIKPLISDPLKKKLEREAKEMNVIKNESGVKTAFFDIFS